MDEITQWLFMDDDEKKQCLLNASNRKQAPKTGKNDYEHYV
jgi:predicted Fe-S protein YdhL (DUF1289 family)